jgi:hypothetical protein
MSDITAIWIAMLYFGAQGRRVEVVMSVLFLIARFVILLSDKGNGGASP